jgi:CTP synthase (UTP-ammonia lyase)
MFELIIFDLLHARLYAMMNRMSELNIGIIGEFDETFPPHVSTEMALRHSASFLNQNIRTEWLPTDHKHDLKRFDALWCAPGSPYRDMESALSGIRFAREQSIPFLGTCGGFQHAVLEFGRNVMNIADAAHAEYDPYASCLFVQPLACQIKGLTMRIQLDANSRVAEIYEASHVEETYYCNFGMNPDYYDRTQLAGLSIVGWDHQGEARIVELPEHPFFLATLFVPQSRSLPESPHPIVTAFMRAGQRNANKHRTGCEIVDSGERCPT